MFRNRSLVGLVALVLVCLAMLGVSLVRSRPAHVPDEQRVTVSSGDLTVTLTESGTVAASDASVYRLPVGGRDFEIISLAPEGTIVHEGDLVVQFDATAVERELSQAEQVLRQAAVDADTAQAELEDAIAAEEQAGGTQAQMDVDEAVAAADLAVRRHSRLRRQFDDMSPLLATGYVTRDELERLETEVEAAASAVALASKRLSVLKESVQPRLKRQSILRVGRQRAALTNAQARRDEATAQVEALREAVDSLSVFSRAAGMVVHGELLGSVPRRKVRPGDRVTATQVVVTIPDLRQMRIETSIAETDVLRVRPGQAATVDLEAFPGERLPGVVRSIGAMAAMPAGTTSERRFDILVDLGASTLPLRPDMAARVTIAIGSAASATLVPIAALEGDGASRSALVVTPTGLEKRAVIVGLWDRSFAEVLDGLRVGERVALVQRDGDAP